MRQAPTDGTPQQPLHARIEELKRIFTSAHSTTLHDARQRISELNTVFQLAERVFPILTDFLQGMTEIIPLIDEINQSIMESTARLPKASSVLYKVTTATESATTEILDVLEAMTGEIKTMERRIEKLSRARDEQSLRAAPFLAAVPAVGNDRPWVELAEFQQYLSVHVTATAEELRELRTSLGMLQGQVNAITIALQVQDITSQQLAAVNHIVKSVHTLLNRLIERLNNSELKTFQNELQSAAMPQVFDPDASWYGSTMGQKLADDLLQPQPQNSSGNHSTSAGGEP